MFKWGINLLFVVFAEIIFCMMATKELMGGPLIVLVCIFFIEFTIVGVLLYKGYMEENKKLCGKMRVE